MKIKLVFIFYLKVEIKNANYIFDVHVCQQVAMLCHQSRFVSLEQVYKAL